MMIVDQKYWDTAYEEYEFCLLPKDDPTIQLINKFIPAASKGQQAFEAGCYPGRFIVGVGEKGYRLNGCDLTPKIKNKLAKWLVSYGFDIGNFEHIEFDNYPHKHKYHVVCSFGFIEHFTDYKNVFFKHLDLVEDGGWVLIQFPNFNGFFQKILHVIFDVDNFNNHVIESMDVAEYQKIVPNNFEIIFCGYYGGFDFWTDDFNKKNGKVKRFFLNYLFRTRRFWKFLPNCKQWSPYGAIVLKKIII